MMTMTMTMTKGGFQELAAALLKHAPKLSADAFKVARRMRRLAIPAARLAETACDRGLTRREEDTSAKLELAFKALCESVGCKARIYGDPRGFVFSVLFPDGFHNSWGGSECGFGVA
jgi:hypothetical protein